ncbi:Hypothetical protein, putative [Bodo saltans]|uniref:Nuclear nucleic acid-binding protein C1D n=1 Tax=Bodo saltans TaxID=75058 RepID=A0A0S4J9Q1_BODSA|nr:Hypothetical protein, putative [Bodo saltans]|eukprot:CUG86857.1 Hypothetical protein, putative [Bodo saltans]
MEVDPDIAELLSSMDNSLLELQQRVQGPLAQLNEDVVASNYPVEDQAKITLATAFTLIMSYYCHKRLHNEPIDPQLKLKVERVSEYVKKLREIKEIERLRGLTLEDDGTIAPESKRPRIDKAATQRIVQNAIGVNERLS